MTGRRLPWTWGLPVAALALVPWLAGDFLVAVFNEIGMGALVALGLILLTGIAGTTSFGQAAFVGIAAYASAWASTRLGWSPWLGLLLALAVTAAAAALIGLLTLRLGGHFLPLSTIAWGLSISMLFGNVEAFGGHAGLSNIPAAQVGPLSLAQPRVAFVLIWLAVALALVVCHRLLHSRIGRAMRGLRGGPVLMASVGADAFRVRLVVFVIAALLAALAGWLYAHVNRFVSPSPFDVRASIEYLLMAVAGGLGHLAGAVVGAAAVLVVKDLLQDVLPLLSSRGAQLDAIVFAALFIVLLLFARGGVLGGLQRWRGRRGATSARPDPSGPAAAAPPLPRRMLPAPGEPVLRVRGVGKRFGGLAAVDQVDFDVAAGEIVGLIGPNGAGKSTLFNLVTGVLPLTAGRVAFLGQDVTGLPQRVIARRGIARTFQHVKLRGRQSLLENVAFGTHARTRCGVLAAALRLDRREERQVRAEALRQLARVGLAHRAHEPAEALPFGMQRLLEIARALAADPVLLVLDEPAAGLRHPEKTALADLLRRLRDEGITILIVEHDMDMVMRLVDRLVVMDFGCRIFDGPPAAARADARVQAAYLGGSVDTEVTGTP